MSKDSLHHQRVVDNRDDPHGIAADGAAQRVDVPRSGEQGRRGQACVATDEAREQGVAPAHAANVGSHARVPGTRGRAEEQRHGYGCRDRDVLRVKQRRGAAGRCADEPPPGGLVSVDVVLVRVRRPPGALEGAKAGGEEHEQLCRRNELNAVGERESKAEPGGASRQHAPAEGA